MISNILNQITNDINNIRDDIGTGKQFKYTRWDSGVNDIADGSYMLAITAFGVGAAGILTVRTR
jgi:hypothetical protein